MNYLFNFMMSFFKVVHFKIERMDIYKYTLEKFIIVQLKESTIWIADCIDLSEKCALWAFKGECEENRVWMTNICRKSCNVCGGKINT